MLEALKQWVREARDWAARILGWYSVWTAGWAQSLEAVDPERAHRLYAQALRQTPRSPHVRALYARFLETRRNDLDLAEHYYREAVEIDPHNAHFLALLADFLMIRRNGDLSALPLIEQARKREPENLHLLLEHARQLAHRDQHLGAAMPLMLEALNKHTDDGTISFVYGSMLAAYSQNDDEAETYLLRANSILGNWSRVPRELGDLCVKQKRDYGRAAAFYRQATERDPDDADSFLRLAKTLRYALGDLDGAHDAYRRAAELSQDWIPSYHFAEFLSVLTDDAADALKHYQRALDLAGIERWSIRWNLAYLYVRAFSDPDSARAQFERAVEEKGGEPAYQLRLAFFLARELGETDAALRIVDEIDPDQIGDPRFVSLLAGFTDEYRKDDVEAERLFQQALTTSPDDAIVLTNFGLHSLEHDRVDQGLDFIRRAMSEVAGPFFESWQLIPLFAWIIYGPREESPAILSQLKRMIAVGVRSEFSTFRADVAKAQSTGHPWSAWLQPLADVITMRSKPDILDAWPAWRDA